MADDVEKRLHYYTEQFLQENDFTDEQKYFIDRLDRHHRFLHTPGVADGLAVKGELSSTQVTVGKGTAIDGNGKQIVLKSDRPVDWNKPELLQKLTDDKNSLLIVISYDQQPDPKVEPGDERFPRWLEQPQVQAILEKENPSEVEFIRLARLKVSREGKLLEPPEDIRKKAGQQPIPDQSITQTKLDQATQNKLVNLGNNHDHTGGNGASIKHSSLNKDDGSNPHKTTAADVNALSLNGGTVKGPVTIDNPGRLDVFGRTFVKIKVPGVFDGNNNISDKGSLFVVNTEAKSYGLVAKVSATENEVPQKKEIPAAAMVAIASFDGVHGIYATSNTGTPALKVDGTAEINGKLSGTHIVDTFTNASGQRLTTGDVVKLKGTPVTRFRGQQNKAPIAEVTLADRENDTLAIGIVDGKAFRDNVPDTKLESESAFIEDGEDLYLVTLGVFAHCKVDATEAPIEVGDLLTTSKNPGHAKKATEPKLGSIIGKALQPLEKGTGEISVFVNIQ